MPYLLGLVFLVSAWRGFSLRPLSMGFIYYVVDYSEGLIRRGLVGEVTLLVFSRAQAMQAWLAAIVAHQLVCLAVAGGVLAWCARALRQPGCLAPARLWLIAVVFATSQFLPTMFVLTTYVDSFVFALLAGGFALATTRRYRLAACVGLVGPFVHEIFVLLWLPLALMLVWRDGLRGLARPSCLAACVGPLTGAAVLFGLESHTALALQLARAPLAPDVKAVMLREQMGHTLRGDFILMLHLYATYPVRAGLSIVLFLTPTLAMLALAAPALSRRGTMLLAMAGLAPLGVLALEFDLSRFVTMTQLTTMLAVLFIAGEPARAPSPAPSRAVAGAAAAFAALLLALPLFYGYFDQTIAIGPSLLGHFYAGFANQG